MALIPLIEYARKNGKNERSIRLKASKGYFNTAMKIGRDWMIDENEPYVDLRVKSGKYVDFRKKLKKNKMEE